MELSFVNNKPYRGGDLYLSKLGKNLDFSHEKIKRIIPLKELSKNYKDLSELALIFNHEVVETESGIWRWKRNNFINWISDYCGVYTPSGPDSESEGKYAYGSHCTEFRASISLNVLVGDLHRGMFSMEEWIKYNMQIGYSLSGFYDIFAQHEAYEYGLEGSIEPKYEDRYTETVIDYMIKKHSGKVLKL